MNKRLRTIILVIIIVIALTLLAWWLWLKFSPAPEVEVIKPEPSVTKQLEESQDKKVQEELNKQIAGKSDEEISDQAKIMSAARFFVERYGSFSSQADWQNLVDVKPVVTNQLWAEFENLMLKSSLDSEAEYYSLSTKVLSIRLVSQSDSQATVETKTQKQEISGEDTRVFYQDITVSLVKNSNQWLVSDFDLGKEKQ